jgi:SAM-dependent methyltransferase
VKVCLQCDSRFRSDDWSCPRCDWRPPELDGFVAFAPENATAIDGLFDPSFAGLLASLEPKSFWYEARSNLITWAFRRYLPNSASTGSFFDVGCGNGFVLQGLHREFPALQLSGGDLLVDELDVARERVPNAAIFQLDALALPFDAEFDVAGCFDVLEHMKDDGGTLHQIAKIVKPGGHVLLTVPQHPFLWRRSDDFAHHQRRYGRARILALLRQAGFSPVCVTSFVTLLLPLVLLSKGLESVGVGSHEPFAELRQPNKVRQLCTAFMAVERRLIERGARFPFGGSLFAVATRR